jgi:hypothetical protein
VTISTDPEKAHQPIWYPRVSVRPDGKSVYIAGKRSPYDGLTGVVPVVNIEINLETKDLSEKTSYSCLDVNLADSSFLSLYAENATKS